MDLYVLTGLAPVFSGFLQEGVVRIASEKKLVNVQVISLRDFTTDPHRKIDDRPYGGGPGMVLKVDPIYRAYQWVVEEVEQSRRREGGKADIRGQGTVGDCLSTVDRQPSTVGDQPSVRTILLSAAGSPWTQEKAREAALESTLILVCGRYEGVDERVKTLLQPEEISLGAYLLSGGEVAAMALMESVIRLIPGVVGNPDSLVEETFEMYEKEFPHYTRPQTFQALSVPDILLHGNHREIQAWRQQRAVRIDEGIIK